MEDKKERVENERALIGCLLLDAERCVPLLSAKGIGERWFSDAQCAAVWCAIDRLRKSKGVSGIDPLTVLNEVRVLNKEVPDSAVVGVEFIQSCVDDTPTAAHVEFYADTVKGQYIARKAKREALTFISSLETGPAAAIQHMSGKLMGLLEEATKDSVGDDRAQVIDGVMRQFEEAHRIVMVEGKGKAKYCPGLPLPWQHLTHLYSGLNPGLNIVSGRPSTGKTAMITNWLDFWCDHMGLAGGLNSLDMTRHAMWARSFSEMSRVSLPKATFGMTSKEELEKLRASGERMKKWRLDMRVCRDVEEFRSWVTLGVMKRGWRFCVVDFIQLLSFRDCYRMGVDDRTAYISGVVKGLGNDLGIPMVALSQLNRECEKEGGRPPKPSDLRGGGSLEQDALTVLMLRKDDRCEEAWREFPPKMLTPFGGNEQMQTYLARRLRPVFAGLEKNQQGNVGDVPFVFYKNYFTFKLADYLAEPVRTEVRGKQAGWDFTPLFSRIHPDWRQGPEDEALRKSRGLVDDYEDGTDR